MKAFPKSQKLKAFIAPNMNDPIIFLDNNWKSAVYTGVNIHVLYHYLDNIVDQTTLTISGQLSHHFGPLSYTNIDIETLHPIIVALRMRQKNIL